MKKKTTNKFIKGGAVFCALFCVISALCVCLVGAKSTTIIEDNGNLFSIDDVNRDYTNETFKIVANINECQYEFSVGGTLYAQGHVKGLKEVYVGDYQTVINSFLSDFFAHTEQKNEWEGSLNGCQMSNNTSIKLEDINSYYYVQLIEEENMSSFIGDMFSGFGDTIDGLGNGIKNMFNHILWTDGTAESGLSDFAKFGFVIAGLSMACGLGYVIIRKIRG